MPVLVHPTDPGGPAAADEHALFAHVGYPLDTTVAIARLIFSGALERFPRVPWIFYHCGGAAPYLRGRWDRGYRSGFPEAPGLSRVPSEYAASLYFDTLVYDAATLRFLVQVVGADRVLTGTDYPYALMADEDPVGTVRRIPGLKPAARAKILGGNAARLFGLTARSVRSPRHP